MKIQRTLPPAAAPIYLRDIFNGIRGMIRGTAERERFRNELKDHFNIKYCFLVSSGKAALYCILKALHKLHPDKDEVLIPAYNCYSVPSAIVYAGLKVRLCDVHQDTLDFDFPALSRELENVDRLLCVVPTHLFGPSADVARVKKIADDRVVVVEDAAQAFGTENNGQLIGLSGDVGFFSLGRGKSFSTVEGGIVITDNDEIGKSLAGIVEALPEYSPVQKLRLALISVILAILSHPLLFWLPKGLPFLGIGETLFERSFPIRKLSPFQAGITAGWKNKLKHLILGRKTMAGLWRLFFQNNSTPGISALGDSSVLLPPQLRFPLRIDNDAQRDRIINASEKKGLGISATYPESLEKITELAEQVSGQYPHAALCARTLVTLPIHCYVRPGDVEKIKALVRGE
jgi:perosamine synthetase